MTHEERLREAATKNAEFAKNYRHGPYGPFVEFAAALDSGARALALLKKLEWAGMKEDYGGDWEPACPSCGGIDPQRVPSAYYGHRPDCELAALIGEAK